MFPGVNGDDGHAEGGEGNSFDAPKTHLRPPAAPAGGPAMEPAPSGTALAAFLSAIGQDAGATRISRALAAAANPMRVGRRLRAAGVAVDDRQAAEVCWLVQERLADYGEEVGSWIADATPALVAALVSAASESPPAPPRVRVGASAQLTALAEALADGEPSCSLTVRRERLAGRVRGLFSRTEFGAVIFLDDRLDGEDLDRTFAHELGHCLDPHFGDVMPAGSELFADAMRDLLLEHHPVTRSAAEALVPAAEAACPPWTREVAPTAPDELLAWAVDKARAL